MATLRVPKISLLTEVIIIIIIIIIIITKNSQFSGICRYTRIGNCQ